MVFEHTWKFCINISNVITQSLDTMKNQHEILFSQKSSYNVLNI